LVRVQEVFVHELVEHVALAVRRRGDDDALDGRHRVDDDGEDGLPDLLLVLEERELVDDKVAGEAAQARGLSGKRVDLRPIRELNYIGLDLRAFLQGVELFFALCGRQVRRLDPVLALVERLEGLPFGRRNDEPL